LEAGKIITPPEKAIKNDSCWENELSDRSITCLENWFEQRANRPKYDDSDHVWLNREGNPYNSHNLNRLLRNLMDEAGIKPNGRILSWHSIRHSTGCYLYNQHKDLTIVADVLRQNSLEAAKRYAHPTPEMKKDAVEALQRGGL
jgi:site-specific recombinase XerD